MLEGWGWLVGTVVVVAGVMLVAGVVVAVDGRQVGRNATTPPRRAAASRARRSAAVSTALLVLAVGFVVVSLAVGPTTGSGRTSALPGFVLVVLPLVGLIALLLAEWWSAIRWPRAQGALREARVSERTVAEILPARQRTVWPWFVALVVTCLALGLSSSGPRSVSRVIDRYEAYTFSPYPGWLWTIPVLVVALVAAAVLELALRAISARPRAEGVDEAWDMWLRRRSARRLVRVARLVVGLTTAGLVAVAALGIWIVGRGHGDNQTGLGDPSQLHVVGAQALAVVAVVMVLASLAQVVLPSRDPAPEAEAAREPVGTDA